MRMKIAVVLIMAVGFCWAADLGHTRELLEAILSENDESRIAKLSESLSLVGDEPTETASAEDIAALLRLAKKCILSPHLKVRHAGLLEMFSVSLRPDSASLLEPYIDDLGALLKQPDQPIRNMTMWLLSLTRPAPSPKALLYLAGHMTDKNTPVEEVGYSASGLISPPRAIDPAALRTVLNVVRERNSPELTAGIVRTLGLHKLESRHDEALKFIAASLTDVNSSVRREAVEAVGRMSTDVKAKFASELQRVIANPEETPETRSLAGRVLVE